jgi:cytochrome c oxidase subunit 2
MIRLLRRLSSPRLRLPAALATVLALAGAALGATGPVEPEKGFGFPRDVSVDGWRIDWLIDVTMIFVALLFVIMCIWMIWAAIAHDEKHTAEYDHGTSSHSVTVALVLSSVIFFVVDGNLFYNSVVDLKEAFWNFSGAESQPDALRIEVQARQWAWEFRYAGPDGEFNSQDDIVTLNDMRVAVDTPVILQVAAIDVIHSLYLPNLRQKIDAVPGYVNPLWFEADETGAFDIACAQHCGVHHYKMKGTIHIVTREEFDAWAVEASENAKRAYDPDDTDAHWGWPWEALESW